jgi:hypothetical protein
VWTWSLNCDNTGAVVGHSCGLRLWTPRVHEPSQFALPVHQPARQWSVPSHGAGSAEALGCVAVICGCGLQTCLVECPESDPYAFLQLR